MQEKLGGESQVFLDANTMDKDGLISIKSVKFSEDGELCAYSFSEKGSDWASIKVRFDIISLSGIVVKETGAHLRDTIAHVKFENKVLPARSDFVIFFNLMKVL